MPSYKLTNVTSFQEGTKGKSIYEKTCVAFHQVNGQGIPYAFPPLAKSDFLNKDANRAIQAVLHGLKGPIAVNGKKFNSVRIPQGLNDQQVADVLTHV